MGRRSNSPERLSRPAKAPKYTNGYVDNRGKPRWYFRKKGSKKIPLPGLPWSPLFMEAYEAALAAAQKAEPEPARVVSGSVHDLVGRFFQSPAFQDHAENTRDNRRRILEKFREKYKDNLVRQIERKHMRAIHAQIEKPSAANEWLKAVRSLMRYAISLGWIEEDPTEGVKKRKIKSDGYHTWTDEEVTIYEDFYPIGTKARLAMALFVFTAQRRSDVVKMGWRHVRDGVLSIRQTKGGNLVDIPIHPELKAALDAVPRDQATFLVTEYGKPFSVKGFGSKMRAWADAAGVPKNCSSHGLRKTSLSRLADASCTAHEIMAISGHTDIKEVELYTKAANRKRLAKSAMKRMVDDRGHGETGGDVVTSAPGEK